MNLKKSIQQYFRFFSIVDEFILRSNTKNIHDIKLLFRTHKKLGFTILKDNESPTRKQESKLFCGYRFLVERNHHQLFYCCCISNDMGDFCICRTKYKKNTIIQSQKLLFLSFTFEKYIFFLFVTF